MLQGQMPSWGRSAPPSGERSVRGPFAGGIAAASSCRDVAILHGRDIDRRNATRLALFEWPRDADVQRTSLLDRYLSASEQQAYARLGPRRREPWLAGRIAAKDAACAWLRECRGLDVDGPRSLVVSNGETGAPKVDGNIAGLPPSSLCLSVSHKGRWAAAIVGEHAVGIDLERIEVRSKPFLAIVFAVAERQWLNAADGGEDATRGWVAKEVAAKIAGTGLCGRLRDFEIEVRDGNHFCVNGRWIVTRMLDDVIVGWSLPPTFRGRAGPRRDLGFEHLMHTPSGSKE